MKKTIMFFVFILLFSQLQAQYKYSGEFLIRGDVSGIKGAEKIRLIYTDYGKKITDSIIVKDGHFFLSGHLKEPRGGAILSLQTTGGKEYPCNKYTLYLEPTQIDLIAKDSLSSAIIKGSQVQSDYLSYKFSISPFNNSVAIHYKKYEQLVKAMDKEGSITEGEIVDSINLIIAKVQKSFVVAHPKSPVALDALWGYYTLQFAGSMPFQSFYGLLDTVVQKLTFGIDLGKRYQTRMSIAPGAKAMTFTLKDMNGKTVNLKSFKGKYIFLDFWASWCKYCVQELPYIKMAYEKYKNKNFVVISVSKDYEKDKDKWLEAIQKHDMQQFVNLLDEDEKYGKHVSNMYNIGGIPRNFLIDPNGTIISNDLFGFQLEDKLDKTIK